MTKQIQKNLVLELYGGDERAYVDALRYAANKIEDGYTEVDLRNEYIESGFCNIEVGKVLTDKEASEAK